MPTAGVELLDVHFDNRSVVLRALRSAKKQTITIAAVAAALALSISMAAAQTYGIATMQPGTLSYTAGSAIAKVLKDKDNLNVLVQPAAGESTLIPLINRGDVSFGIANIFEVEAAKAANPHLRLIGKLHSLRGAFFVRKTSSMKTVADLKGKKVVMGFSAMRTIDPMVRAILAAGGLTGKDIKPVLVPNVVRGADDFVSGAADTFIFAFGAPKVREVDATVGGIRALSVPAAGMAAADRILPHGYLSPATPNPFFVGVDHPMGVYTWDNLLLTNDKVPAKVVEKIIATLVANKKDLVAVQPALRELSAQNMYKEYGVPYAKGALAYFKAHHIEAEVVK